MRGWALLTSWHRRNWLHKFFPGKRPLLFSQSRWGIHLPLAWSETKQKVGGKGGGAEE